MNAKARLREGKKKMRKEERGMQGGEKKGVQPHMHHPLPSPSVFPPSSFLFLPFNSLLSIYLSSTRVESMPEARRHVAEVDGVSRGTALGVLRKSKVDVVLDPVTCGNVPELLRGTSQFLGESSLNQSVSGEMSEQEVK